MGVGELLLTARSRLEPLPGKVVMKRFIGMTVVFESRSKPVQLTTAPPESVVPPFQAWSAPGDVVLTTVTVATTATGVTAPGNTVPAQFPRPACPVPPW